MDNSAVSYWNEWNLESREVSQGRVSHDQARVVEEWLRGRSGLSILEAGCGTGWMSARLAEFGSVHGIDQANEVVERARHRVPHVSFEAGDLLETDLGSGYDVAVTLEVLSHVDDQALFLRRIHGALKRGGQLLLATQNKPILSKYNNIPPPGPGQLRHWLDRHELVQLVEDAGFSVDEVFLVTPQADHGIMRLVAKAGRMTRTDRVMARLGFGWTIMLSARAT